MKTQNLKTVTHLAVGLAAAAFITACSTAEPQAVIVTATPTATPVQARATSSSAAVTPEPTVVELTVKPAAPVFEAGTLLQDADDNVFYLTEDGRRQQFYDWNTVLAFGFSQEDIVKVEADTLAALPRSGELTRLVVDEDDHLYWVAQGQRWLVNDWKQVGQRGWWRTTPLDASLQQQLPVHRGFAEGSLLQAGDKIYYFSWHTLIPFTAKVGPEVKVIDIPPQMVRLYRQQEHLDYASLKLRAGTTAVNVRRQPSLQADVLGVVKNTDDLSFSGRSADNAWLQINRGWDQTGWVAADLVEETLALSLLPVVKAEVVATDVPQAQPAAVVETSTPQPLYCTLVPIRGFGKVWSDHREVKETLGCADAWQGGEQGTQAAVQTFQNGVMVWLAVDSVYDGADPVYAFFADGTFQRFGDLGPADPAKVGSIPTGFYPVGDKFSKVYWEGTGAQVKERLGYAVSPTSDSAGAFQQFSNGRMFWTEALDRIFVIYEYGYFDQNNTYIPVHTWHSYEDKF